MNTYPLVSIIVVNWNGGDVFADCLKSLQGLKYPNWELIVVDNGSRDKSQNLVKKYKLKATRKKIIQNKHNVGFAPANNQGYEIAKGEYILLLNNDTKVTPDFLTTMVDDMEAEKQVGAAQPKLFMMDKKGYLDNAGSFMTWTGFLEHWGYGKRDGREYQKSREVFSAKGACLLIKREVIETVGLFDDTYMSYFEESDFCMRVWIAGWKVKFYPDASIEHKVGYTSERLVAVDVNYHSMKNRIATYIKNLQLVNFHYLVAHILLVKLLGLYYLLRFQFDKFWMIVRALWWNIVHLPMLIKQRRKVQRFRKKSDKEIFETTMHTLDLKTMFMHFLHTEGNFKRKDKNYSFTIAKRGRVRVCLEMIKKQKLKDKVLVNVGSSFGWMEKSLTKSKLKKIVGIDPDENAISYAQKNVKGAEFSVGIADDIPMKSSSVDIVTLFDVIEHVPDGRESDALDEIQRVLKKNGVLLLSTPNSHALTNLLDPAWYFGHRHYTKEKLTSLLAKSGFEIIACDVKGGLWFSTYLLWLYFMKWVMKKTNPRFKLLEKMDDRTFSENGIHTIFVEAKKK